MKYLDLNTSLFQIFFDVKLLPEMRRNSEINISCRVTIKFFTYSDFQNVNRLFNFCIIRIFLEFFNMWICYKIWMRITCSHFWNTWKFQNFAIFWDQNGSLSWTTLLKYVNFLWNLIANHLFNFRIKPPVQFLFWELCVTMCICACVCECVCMCVCVCARVSPIYTWA